MRLKIDGPITLERLEEAFNEARRLLNVPDARFYGANIYLKVFDEAGKPILPVYGKKKEPDIFLAVAPDEQKWPLVAETVIEAAAAAERQKKAKERREARAEEQRKRREQEKKSRENKARLRQTLESSKRAFGTAVAQFNSITLTVGAEQLALELNAQIFNAWKESGMVRVDGSATRDARPRPYFVALEDRVVLCRGGQASSMINMSVPFGHISSEGEAKLHWRHLEWALAVKKITDRLNAMAVSYNLPLFQIKLGKITVHNGYTSQEMLVWVP